MKKNNMIRHLLYMGMMSAVFLSGTAATQLYESTSTNNTSQLDWADLILGPLGALVLSILGLYFSWKFINNMTKKSDLQQRRIEELQEKMIEEKDKQIEYLRYKDQKRL